MTVIEYIDGRWMDECRLSDGEDQGECFVFQEQKRRWEEREMLLEVQERNKPSKKPQCGWLQFSVI